MPRKENRDRSSDQPAETLLDCLERLALACPECRAVLAAYPLHRIALRAGAAPERVRHRPDHPGRHGTEGPVDDPEGERQRARSALDALLEGKVEDTMTRLTTSPRFQTWGFGSILADEAEAHLRRGRAREAVVTASLMAVVADRLEPERYGLGVVAGLRAAARATLSDAFLAFDDLDAAEQALRRAEHCLRAAPVDRFYETLVELARCRLLLALGETREAAARARALFKEALEEQLGEVMVEVMEILAVVATDAPGEAGTGLRILGLLEILNADGPRAGFIGQVPLAIIRARALFNAGKLEEALLVLDRMSEEGGGVDRIVEEGLRAWRRGVALRALGRAEEAAADLAAATSFLQGGLRPLSSLRASLELAGLLLEKGDVSRFASTVDAMESALCQRQLPRQAVAVVLRFQERVWRFGPVPEDVQDAARQLDRLGQAPLPGREPPGDVH